MLEASSQKIAVSTGARAHETRLRLLAINTRSLSGSVLKSRKLNREVLEQSRAVLVESMNVNAKGLNMTTEVFLGGLASLILAAVVIAALTANGQRYSSDQPRRGKTDQTDRSKKER